MRVTFAGTGCGATLNADRAGAGIHTEAAESRLLLDCGPGVVDRILRAGLDHTAIAHVFFSHLHSDHAIGIAELLYQYTFRSRPLPAIYGPAGTAEYLAAAVGFVQANTGPRHDAQRAAMSELRAIESGPDDEREIDGIELTTREVPHVDYLECVARRLAHEGRSLVYSGDTRLAPEILVPLSEGTDVLIHEAYTRAAMEAFAASLPERVQGNLYQAFENSHSEGVGVGKLAAEAGAGKLVLTHLLPGESDAELVAACATHFDGEVVVAYDGLQFEV